MTLANHSIAPLTGAIMAGGRGMRMGGTNIAAGRLAVGRCIRDHAHVQVDFSDGPEAFVNLNTPEELAAHQR